MKVAGKELITLVKAFLVPIVFFVAVVVVVMVMAACGPVSTTPSPPWPNYEATIAAVQQFSDYWQGQVAPCDAARGVLEEQLYECRNQPAPTPHVIVVTAVPPPTATPQPWVSCESANYDWTVVVHTGTTVRDWHSDTSTNLGYAEIGASGRLMDKSMDHDALWWWRVEGIRTDDYPSGEKDGDPLKGWVLAIYSGCIAP